MLATYPLILIGRARTCRSNNLPEFIAYAQANPGKVNYGHQGKGNTGHLLGELMMLKGGFKMTEIPYRGSAPAINDLLAGNIDMVPDYLLANKQNIDAGKLKFARHRQPRAAQGLSRTSRPSRRRCRASMPITWMAVSAPPGTPKEITKKISDAIGQGFQQPDMQARILTLEAEPLGTTPEQMRDMIQQSLDIWGPVVEAAKISVE